MNLLINAILYIVTFLVARNKTGLSPFTFVYGVCIGKKGEGKVPVIGDNVFIGLLAKVLRDVRIASGYIIALNAVVLQCPEDVKVVLGDLQKCLYI